MGITIFHNPRCSKSRDTLALLRKKGISPTIVAYLEQPPSPAELGKLLSRLGFVDARQLMRKNEAEYTELGLDNPGLDQEALIAAMVAHPRLIERPIVVNGEKAAIGRPPENVLTIL
jgi:arsenate reductase